MNMPFELGVLLAWGKETFVITSRATRTIALGSELRGYRVSPGKRPAPDREVLPMDRADGVFQAVELRHALYPIPALAGDSSLTGKGLRSTPSEPARRARRSPFYVGTQPSPFTKEPSSSGLTRCTDVHTLRAVPDEGRNGHGIPKRHAGIFRNTGSPSPKRSSPWRIRWL